MVIANPIYDVVFKRMMENDRVVKFFIGTLLEQTIETVELKPQEFTYTDEMIGVAVFRLDFIATIKTDEGEYKKVLIEIQKSKNQKDLMRFRKYLASQYQKEYTVNNGKIALPITTIYVLGFKLPEIETACLKVERNYLDLVNKTPITTKSDFVEKLTHDSFIVQVERITNRYQTKLDKLLSIFEQTNFVDDDKIIKEFTHEIDLDDIKIATDLLHHAAVTPEEKKKIETEQEAWRSIDAMLYNQRKEFFDSLALKDAALAEKDAALAQKNTALAEKDAALAKMLERLNELEKRQGDTKS